MLRGANVDDQMRDTKNVVRVQSPARVNAGFVLANPRSRW
jgi:hypothetical protein